jgi:6-phosphogluconolactonase
VAAAAAIEPGRKTNLRPVGDDVVVDVDVVVAENAEAAAEAAAEILVEAARAGSEIALSGGSTPTRAYELAAAAEPDWGSASVWLVDERMVPADDPLSNAGLVKAALLASLSAAPRTHFVRTDLSPTDAADAYDEELRAGALTVALLGVGADGHTASLFPDAPELHVQGRLAVATEPGLEPWVPRVTLTIPALAAVAHVVFVVTGASKAEAVRRALAEPPSPATPASLVRSHGRTTTILDVSAASLLPQPS